MKNILMIIMGIAAVGFTANAYADWRGSESGPNYSPERHEQMTKAFDSNDYKEWKKIRGDRGRVGEIINEENFAKFSEARRLMLEGKTEEANKLRNELGLQNVEERRQRNGRGDGYGRNENRGSSQGGNYVDKDGNGICDNMR